MKVFLILKNILESEVEEVASQKNLEEKQSYIKKISDKIKNSNVGIIISYKGIDSKKDTKMRKELREAEVDYFVVKNTMLKRATKQVGFDFSNELIGSTAIALSNEDPIAVSKILTNYAKELEKNTEFKIKTGFLDGKIIDVKTIKELGALQSKKQILGNLANVLIASIRKLAIGLSEVAKKIDENAS